MKRVFKKVKADKKILIGYGSSLLFLLITYSVTLYVNSKLKEKTSAIEHTYRLISNLEIMLSKVKDAETGVRGFALTRDESFLEPYKNSKAVTDSLLHIIVKMSENNTAQVDRLSKLKILLEKKFKIFINAVNYYQNNSSDSSFNNKDLQMEAKRQMDNIRYYVDIIQKDERKDLAVKDAALKTIVKRIDTITSLSLIFTISLVIIGFLTYTKENKDKKVAINNIKVYQQQLSNRINQLSEANMALIQMRRMEKFAATGRIARTIAHEVRNPLTNINLANSQLKTDIINPDDNIHHLLDIIDRNSQRINRLIADLLQSTKFTELVYTTLPITKIMEESIAMAEDRIKLKKIKIEKSFNTDCIVKVDYEKIKIPFINIIINAIEAMEEEKGILKISTKQEGAKCIIKITDNGTGMDEAEQSKLFEPYFTTKPKGNGLGLTNTQNIILNHQGTINVRSEVGIGTTFIIELVAA